jgi:carbon-monoxide dehydrogenase small subunit
MLITARDLVLRLPEPDERRIRLGLSGNLCRCTGYVGIVRAVQSVIATRRARGVAPIAVALTSRLGPVGARIGSQLQAGDLVKNPVATELPAPVARLVADFKPAHTFEQSFVIARPPKEVFAAFGQIREIAACIPGAAIDAEPAPDRVDGSIRVRLGPITAAFRGSALIERFEDKLEGRILAAGADAGDRSTVKGDIRYRVLNGDEPETARVEMSIGYALKGPLAQFGRPGLVRDLSRRMMVEFSHNLDSRLRGESSARAPRRAGLAWLVLSSLAAGFVRWIRSRIGWG